MKRLLAIAGLIVLALAGIGFAYGQQLGLLATLVFAHHPSDPFDPAKAPPAPDYSRQASWGALPGIQDATDVAPPGVPIADPRTAPVDVFFIHPTTFFSNSQWNQDLDDAKTNRRTDTGPFRAQASAFNGCCTVYAPRYRQFTFSAIFDYDASSRAAEGLAYSDVKRAFEYYIAHHNHGRPFIIASHSQGSRMATRLIPELIDGTPLRARFVAAYMAGTWLPQSWFDKQKTIRPCESATDTGCVLTWSTLAADADAEKQRASFVERAGFPPQMAREHFVCTNPISWTTGPELAPAGENLGGWLPGRSDPPRAIDPHVVSARCDDGGLFISDPEPSGYRVAALPGGNYHNYDYQLFWMNVRQNAIDRSKAFLAAH
jgi:hypothetical protein